MPLSLRALAVVSCCAAITLAIAACGGARGAAVEAPVEITIPPIGSIDGGGTMYASGARPQSGCAVRLGIQGSIQKSAPGCYLDELITKAPGLLRFPCSGDGPVEVDFGDHHYTGRLTAGILEVEVSTELDWEDGCRWGTQAIISGPLVSNGEPTLTTLSWRYRDHVISGTSCSGICVATARIQVTNAVGSGNNQKVYLRNEDDD